MDSVILLVAVCFGGACHDVRLPFDVSVQTCQSVAEEAIAGWVHDHPGYTVTKWHCVEPGDDDL
jgi:hypothetical protein